MANTDSNTNTYFDPLPYADIHHSNMASALANLNFSSMEPNECQLLAQCCEETRDGLCHCLAFLGDSLETFAQHNVYEFTPTSLCQFSHTLTAISQLIPALADLSQRLHVDLQK